MKIVVYTYYSTPWKLQTGDDIRIHYIVKAIKSNLETPIVVYNLCHLADSPVKLKEGVIYVSILRKFYCLIAKLIRWKKHHDLNSLIKLTHYIDEFITAIKLTMIIRRAKILYVLGSMTLFSVFIRVLGIKDIIIIYDPLANYAQTLYLRSRHSKLELLRYGLYLALHKLQLRHSNYIIYPSKTDLENSKKMFNIKNSIIIPNPTPICYESIEEYTKLRMKRRDFTKPYFILLAGGRNKANEEAVKLTIEVFNDLPPDSFRLFITGPWEDMRRYITNPSIEILGVLQHEKLKELLAISDYGLSPIFSHAAGSFLKVLAYIAAGLNIIASSLSLVGIGIEILREAKIRVHAIHNLEEYYKIIYRLINEHHYSVPKKPIICSSQNIPNLLFGINEHE